MENPESQKVKFTMNIEDLANFKLNSSQKEEKLRLENSTELESVRLAKKMAKNNQSLDTQQQIYIAKIFIFELEAAFKNDNQNDVKSYLFLTFPKIINIYDYKFNKISQLIFKQDRWPEFEQIEEEDEMFRAKIEINFLYTELCYRHMNARLSL